MSFTERTGDLLADDKLDAIAHGVNCEGPMGGIAGLVAKKYPTMVPVYQDLCKSGKLNPGQVFPWTEPNKPMVYNLATQQKPGADAQYRHVKKTMKIMVRHAAKNGIDTIGVPQIGCGIGGLDWDKTKSIMQKVAGRSKVNVIAYTYDPPKPQWFKKGDE